MGEDGHAAGFNVRRRLGRESWQKDSRLREDGEQWAGKIAGTLGGAFEGALGPLHRGRGHSAIGYD